MATTTSRLTIDDYERLPQEMAEGHELVDGELVPVSGNTGNHNHTKDRTFLLLSPFVEDRGLGDVITEQEYDFDGNAHAPDVSFYGMEKLPLFQGDKRVQRFVPDLAIEIVSANDTFRELLRKKDRYLRCGTREVWILEPDSQAVYVYSEQGDRILRQDAELCTSVLPGLTIPVKRLFERVQSGT